jgi:hypothetical protein
MTRRRCSSKITASPANCRRWTRRFHALRFGFAMLSLVMTLVGTPLAQRTSASVAGTIADPSGAVVPNAHVAATELSTSSSVNVQSNASGFFLISDLKPGTYRLHVDANGFQGFEQTGITLQVGQAATVNVTLKLGSSSQEVSVSSAPPLVDTSSQTVSFAITPQFTEDIPLNGRNVLQLMALAPDTSEHVGDNYSNQEATRPESGAGFVTASGEARENSTAFFLDGGLNEDTYTNVANVFPNPDAIQEFTFETNSYSAKYGGRGGGVVNAVTRSGTNQLHGTAYEYLRNGSFNASNYFSTSPDTLKRNQFGFSVGGPIQKNKTFAFLAYQRTTFRYGTTSNVAYGPTPAELSGDWSAIPQQISNPFTGVPYANNQIPTSSYDPISLKLLSLVPTGSANDGRILYNSRQLQNDNQWVGRIDRNFGDKLTLYGSYLWDGLDFPNTPDPSNILTGGPDKKWRSQHVAINAAYRLTNNLLTTLTAAYSRALINYTGSTAFKSLPDLGANYPVWDPSGVKEAGFYIDGWFNAQWLGKYDITRNQYDFNNNWTWVHGQHTLDFGGELTLSQSIVNQAYSSSGYEGWWCASSGYSPVDFMLGENCYFEQYAPSYVAPHGKSPSLYVNDAWRATRRLTVDLGLRWEPWLPWPDSSSQQIGDVISPAAYAQGIHSRRYPNLPPGILLRGDPGVPDGLAPSDWKLFDPRVGLAWDVFGDGKTSVRAGFGIYHDQPFGRMYNEMMSTVPFTQGAVVQDTTVSAYNPYAASPYNGQIPPLESPLPRNTVFPLPLTYAVGFATNYKPPATMQWNLTLERQLGKGVLIRTGYEASESYHMFDSRDRNAAIFIPGQSTVDNTAQRRPWYPDYGGSVIVNESRITSSYNALEVSAEKRMTGNFSFLGGYRWAKCLDIGGSTSTFAFNEFTDANNIGLDRGLCNSDVASQFKMSAVWKTPTIAGLGFVGRHVIGGWTLSGIWVNRDGFPFSVLASTDVNLDGTYYDRASLTGTPSLSSNRSQAAKLAQWFNTAAFQDPQNGSNGTAPRNFLRGPGYANLDFSLAKSFGLPWGPLRDSQKIDVRAEFFNALNHPNFCNPNNAVGSGDQFGRIDCASDPRILQFTLKYSF